MTNPYINLLRTAWKYARLEKKKFILVYSSFTLTNLINTARPLLYGWFINSIQREGVKIISHAWIYVGVYLGLNFLEWMIHGPARVLERSLAFNLGKNFLMETYHQILVLPIKWHQDNHSGAIINRARKAYEALKDFFQSGFMYFHAFMKFIFSFIAMIYFSPLFGTIGICLGLLTVWLIFRFDKPFIKAVHETNEKEHIVSSTLFDSLSNIVTVITLRLGLRMESSLETKVNNVYKPFRRSVIINEWKWFIADSLVAIIYAVVALGYVIQQWKPGVVFYVGGLVTLLAYVNQFTSVFHDVAWQYTQIIQYNTDVLAVQTIKDSYDKEHRLEKQSTFPSDWERIDITNLFFSHGDYYTSQKKVHSLHGIALSLQKGKRVAIIGESGCGKSTLLSIIRGLYPPEKAIEITLNRTIPFSLDALSGTVTLFPQEPEIFENTILYNITLGLPFSDQEVEEVCAIAGFTEVIKSLPNGLLSHIQEKGVNLSGGQKQRLALARGILASQQSDIILLDEPTSSVDPKTETLIYQKLFSAFKSKVIISSLHRLHLLSNFDYVYVMDEGRIAEQGTFSELKENGKIFQELWKHQKEMNRSE